MAKKKRGEGATDAPSLEVPKDRMESAARLREAVAAGGGPTRVAANSGINLRTLNNYLVGLYDIKADALAKLSRATGYRVEWLLTGDGEKVRPAEFTASDARDLQALQRTKPSIPPGAVEVPFYEDLRPAAGGGAVIERETARVLFFDETWLQRFFGVAGRDIIMLAATGESMEDTIHAGDPLIVNISENGRRLGEGIFIIRLEGALMVKRLQPLPGGRVRVSSANGAYEAYELKLEDEALDFAIIGRVLCVCRRL